MPLPVISPAETKRRLAEGSVVLVDIREPAEHAREAIPGAKLSPLSALDARSLADVRGNNAPAVVFHCQSGRRTSENAARLRDCGVADSWVLEGGLAGWKQAGFATRVDRTKPIELQRQVQIAAGSLVLVGLTLALTVSPWFAALSACVGAGLVFAGVSGWCGMTTLLGKMPWNRA